MLLPVIQPWTNEISFVVSTILLKGVYTREAGNKPSRGTIKEENALASYEDAVRYAKPRPKEQFTSADDSTANIQTPTSISSSTSNSVGDIA
jgi:hypothetical protein